MSRCNRSSYKLRCDWYVPYFTENISSHEQITLTYAEICIFISQTWNTFLNIYFNAIVLIQLKQKHKACKLINGWMMQQATHRHTHTYTHTHTHTHKQLEEIHFPHYMLWKKNPPYIKASLWSAGVNVSMRSVISQYGSHSGHLHV